jgi:hypothetical protein
MRYLDPSHLSPISGIVVDLRLLGEPAALGRAESEVDKVLGQHKSNGVVVDFIRKVQGDWVQTTLPAYGGPDAGEAFAWFLNSASRLALLLLRKPRLDFQARELVLQNWVHCFELVTKCRG